jgi:hypothetical protein
MEPVKQPESTTTMTFESEKKQYTPLNLKPYYIYGRFPILLFMGTLGVGAYIASMLYDMFFK